MALPPRSSVFSVAVYWGLPLTARADPQTGQVS
jgi:hypothetical protein